MKKFLIGTAILFIAIQFIDFDVPANLHTDANQEIKAPKEVMDILQRSCYDCHSSSMHYPWYSKVAPVSWFTKSHIQKGRTVVNFSIWESYDDEKKIKVLDHLPKAIKIRMPLNSYLWLHEEAKLSDQDRKMLSKWADELKFELE
ncbi:MAG: heme-binding domain-containing protein [Campylobacterales bacterium]|nr:heme-binding domain-containing protein [Campylobacterales bacterium]MBD3843538.1 heme-binding domain-containing protein [Campylobacterales bacterium]